MNRQPGQAHNDGHSLHKLGIDGSNINLVPEENNGENIDCKGENLADEDYEIETSEFGVNVEQFQEDEGGECYSDNLHD